MPPEPTFRAASTLVFGLLALVACGSRQAAPTLPDGRRLAVTVVMDRSIAPQTPPEKATELQHVADFMEPDLLEVLRSSGYDTSVASASARAPHASGPGHYTLRVKITDYRADSKTARMFVGYGTGSARLACRFELFGPNGASYLSGSPGASISEADWQRVVRKVNQEIVSAVNVRLRQGL